MQTKLINIATVVEDGKVKVLRSNYNGVNPEITNEDAKEAMVALAAMGRGTLKGIERVNRESIHEVEEA